MPFSEEDKQRYRKKYTQHETAYTFGASQFMEQLRNADKFREELDKKLTSAGWVYDAELRLWSHPDDPDTVIMEG